MADGRKLVRVELSFATTESPDALGERIKESVSLIVGRDALEDFRVRTLPLDPKKKDHLRAVD